MKRTRQPSGKPKRQRKPPLVQSKNNPNNKYPEDWQDENSKFAKGNKFYMLPAENVGRPAIYETPTDLFNKAQAYFQWAKDNPLYESKIVQEFRSAVVRQFPKMRALTIISLCNYLGFTPAVWYTYRKKSEGFLYICTVIENYIKDQKYQGAASGFFNHAIIARDLGLVDKQDMTTAGEKLPGNTMEVNMDMSAKDAEKLYKGLLQQGKEV